MQITLAQLPTNYKNLSVYAFIKALTLLKSGSLSAGVPTFVCPTGKISMVNTMAGFGCANLTVTPAIQAAKWLQQQPPKKLLQFLNINSGYNAIWLTRTLAPTFFNLHILVNHKHF